MEVNKPDIDILIRQDELPHFIRILEVYSRIGTNPETTELADALLEELK